MQASVEQPSWGRESPFEDGRLSKLSRPSLPDPRARGGGFITLVSDMAASLCNG